MKSFEKYVSLQEQADIQSLLLETSDEEFDALIETLNEKELIFVEQQLNEILGMLGKLAKGAGKLAMKGAKAAGKAAIKKGKEKFTAKGQADAAERKAAKLAQLRKDKERALAAREKLKGEREALKKLKDKEGESSAVAKLRDKIKKTASGIAKVLDTKASDVAKAQEASEMGQSVKDIIDNLKDGNNVEANKSFDNAMKEKLANALDAEKINIASQMVSKKSEEE